MTPTPQMGHRDRVAVWRRARTVRRRRFLAGLITVGWLWWWANGAPAWTAIAAVGVVFLLLGSTSRGWDQPVAARDWQDLDAEPSRVHIVREDLFEDREGVV